MTFTSNYTNVVLDNVFPVDKNNLENNSNVMDVTVHIEGHTTYQGGISYTGITIV